MLKSISSKSVKRNITALLYFYILLQKEATLPFQSRRATKLLKPILNLSNTNFFFLYFVTLQLGWMKSSLPFTYPMSF